MQAVFKEQTSEIMVNIIFHSHDGGCKLHSQRSEGNWGGQRGGSAYALGWGRGGERGEDVPKNF